LTLFLGKTGTGKTTLLCALAGEKMVLKIPQVLDPNGILIPGTKQVIETENPIPDFAISHKKDSCTPSLKAWKLDKFYFIDSCGFEDTGGQMEGFCTDIANAISLRNVMKVCRCFRVVVVIDYNSLGGGRGGTIANTLRLIARFFSPVSLFLPSISFFFTHAPLHLTLKELIYQIASLCDAEHIKSDTELETIVKYIYNYVVKNKENVIVLPEDLAPFDGVTTKLNNMKDIIQSSLFVDHDETARFGCPLSQVVQASLAKKCQELRLDINTLLSVNNYDDVQRNLLAFQSRASC
jgi:hypothetical protein